MSLSPTPLTPLLYSYLLSNSVREPSLFKELRDESSQDKHSDMQISPDQGQFLSFLIRLIGAKKCIEIGVYMGYSSLWIATSIPNDGKLIACDINAEWSKTALRYWERAGVAPKVTLQLQPASQTLNELLCDESNHNSFDFAFIDADKIGYESYYEDCLKLIRPNGGLLVFDNTLWFGNPARPEIQDESTEAIRKFNTKLHHDPRIDLAMLSIGDGLTLARKKDTDISPKKR